MPTTRSTTTSVSADGVDLLTDALTEVQAQMGRVDTKASMLLAGSLTALSIGVALVAKTRLPVPVTVGAVVVLALVGATVVLLITAVRPDLRGNHGFVRWATAPTAKALLADLADIDRDSAAHQAHRLLSLSRSVDRKYFLVRLAVDLLRAALAVAALTAALLVIACL